MTTAEEFTARTTAFFREAAEEAKRIYDAEGNWIARTTPPQVRERYWLSLALYACGNTFLADTIIRKGELSVSHIGVVRANGSTFDIFHSNIAVICLKMYGAAMAGDVRETLTRLVAEATGPGGGDRLPEYQFHGYNDNMPSKAAMGLILGGELLGDESAVAHGIANLRGLRAMLVRRGTVSEYNSPTYSAVTLHALAEIAEHARSEEARTLARQSETRLWIDLAARFHSEIGCLAGPYSRAYTVDLLATVTCMSSLLWFALGDVAKPSPMILFENDPALVLHHGGDRPFNIAQMSWFASGSYHIPEVAASLFERKSYPLKASATYEMGNVNPDFPARSDAIVSYLQRDYALGTAGKSWLSGDQCAPYFVTYKQRSEVRSHRDVGTVYTKLLINDEGPGFVSDTADSPAGEADNVQSRSGILTVQSEGTAVVLSHPHLSLAAPPDNLVSNTKPIHRLNELVIFPAHYASAAEIFVGGSRRENWSGQVAAGEWIACQRGRLLIAILPIAYSRDFGQASITLERVNNYEVIRSTLYQGDEKLFTRDELRHVCGGFLAEHAGIDDYPSLEAFAADLRAATVTDYVYNTRRTRYIRPATDRKPALDIETSWSPASSEARFVSINGHVTDHPRVHIDGLTESDFPFLTEPTDSTSTFPLPFGAFSPSYNGSPSSETQ